MPDTFYRWFSERKLTGAGAARRRRIEEARLALVMRHALRGEGFDVAQAFTPPIPAADLSADVVYADQVLEHMSGIDAAREFVAEARRALRPGGVFFVVVPDYLKESTFFWDVDYTHNFVTTERRVKQLFNDNGFDVLHVERGIGVA